MAFDSQAVAIAEPVAAPSVQRTSADVESGDRILILAAGAIVIVQLWFGMIGTSFWQDETGTWWIVRDGAAEAIRRAWFWSGQSPLYYLIAWLSARLFGLSEIALRIPSVFAMSGALIFLYRIAARIYDRATAAFVAYVFLCLASFYAVDARPYALALFFLTASTWALLRWLDTGRVLHGVLYAICAALVVYAHCILSLSLAAGGIYAVVVLRREPRRLLWLGLLQAAIVAMSMPLVPQLKSFYATRSAHTFTGLPTDGDLLAGFIPGALAGALILLTWLCTNVRGEANIAGRWTRRAALLAGTWALFAPVVLFLLPAFSDLRLFVDRYYSSALPGQALLLGGLLSSIERSAVRRALLIVLAAGTILVQGRMSVNSHGDDDWRGGLAFVKKEAGSAPVLLVSGFAEGVDFQSVNDPKLRDILFAPEEYYGEPEGSIRVPHQFPARDTASLETLARSLAPEHRFYIVNNKPDSSYELWLLGRLGTRCKSEAMGQRFGLVWISRFTCK